MVSRRAFLGWMASVVPMALVVRRAHAAAVLDLQAGPATLRALAEAVLPSELSAAGVAAEVSAFQRWISGYREGAEVNHAYGSSRVRNLGPTPATLWMRQLDELDAKARTAHGRAFAALTLVQRRTLAREVLGAERTASIGDVAGASHVGFAILAHFFTGSQATDLCYDAKIGKSMCRPLAASTAKPVAIARRSSGLPVFRTPAV
jgi:hypothetical protein